MTDSLLTAEQVADLLRGAEPWLDKRGLAEHLACSVRSVETALAEGLPHAVIFGRVKFRVSEVEPWLEAHGHLERHGQALANTGQVGDTRRLNESAPAPMQGRGHDP